MAKTITKLEQEYAAFAKSDSQSLLKKYLTNDIFNKIKDLRTSRGSTLLDCVQSGFKNPDSHIGIYAPDPEAFQVFADIFNPIIQEYHSGFGPNARHPQTSFGNIDSIGNIDPTGEFVVSTRVRCGRSLTGFPFNPCLTEDQYLQIETKAFATLKDLTGDLAGQYYPLNGMDSTVKQKLISDHFMFKEGDRFLQAANACRFWPKGRGIFHNTDKTFLVWINEEDHMRIISMQAGGDLGTVYKRFVKALLEIEKRLKFSRDERLGYLTFCPTNLGTCLRASVHVKTPKLAENMKNFIALAAKYNLDVRGADGEHTVSDSGIYDISNKRRLGLTEFDAIQEMRDGVMEIIKQEKAAKSIPTVSTQKKK